ERLLVGETLANRLKVRRRGRHGRRLDVDVRAYEPESRRGERDDAEDPERHDADDDPYPDRDSASAHLTFLASATHIGSPLFSRTRMALPPSPRRAALSPCCSASRASSPCARPCPQPAASGDTAARRSASASSRRPSMTRAAPRL